MNTLPDFIRRYRTRILDEWLAEASHLPSAQAHPPDVIRDHMPEFLDHLAEAIERDDLTAVTMIGLPNLHAALRVREGYDLRQVVAEYRAIRTVLLGLYREYGDISEESRPKLRPLATMNAALDIAIADAVDQYSIEQGKAREMFLGVLGHDLREPLSSIAFGARVLLERGGELDPQTLETLGRIASSANRMEAMISDLLDFARGRLGGGFPVVAVPIDPHSLVAETVSDIAHTHPERSIAFEAPDGHDRITVQWDADRIAQALINLLSNAITHGGDPIVVRVEDHADEVVIAVTNTGEIGPAALRSIFAPFSAPPTDRRHERSHSGPERRRGHLGLGLYIVHEIAKAHGGTVEAHSRDGKTTFALTLPHVPSPASTPAPSSRTS